LDLAVPSLPPVTTLRAPRTLLSGSAIGLALFGAIPAAPAQQVNPQAAQTGPVELPTLSVEGSDGSDYRAEQPSLTKLTQPMRDTPQSIAVVTRQLIEDQGATTLRDTLRNVPGISLAAGEFGAQGDNLTIRGFSARNDIYIDGMRDFGGYYRDPFFIENVEVLEGPSSILFGRGSTGGVVNQAAKTPTLAPMMAGSLSFGTDDTKRITADINMPLPEWGEGVAARVNVMANDSGVAGREYARNSRVGFAPSLAFGLGTPTRITLNFLHQSEYDVPDYGLPWIYQAPAGATQGAAQVAPVSQNNFYGFKHGDYLRTNVDIGTAKIEHDFSDALTIRDQARYSHYVRSFRITEPQIYAPVTSATPAANTAGLISPSTPLSSVFVSRNQLYGTGLETLLDNQIDLTARFTTGGFNHTLVAGLEITRETSDPNRDTSIAPFSTTSLLNPNPNQTYNATSFFSTQTKTTAYSQAVYVVDTMEITPQWQLMGGGRFDRFDIGFDQNTYSTAGKQTGALVLSHIDRKPSWRAALVYKPLPNGSIYFSAGTSFNPSAESLSLSTANSSLDPVENTTYEVGTKWDVLNERLSLSGALYQTEQTNLRETIPGSTLQQLVGSGIAKGLTLEAVGHITNEWQVIAGYAYTYSAITKSPIGDLGHRLANVPRHTANIFTSYSFPWKLQIGGGFNYVSSRFAASAPRVVGGVNFFSQAPSYWTANLMAKYAVTDNLSLQVNISNLTDKYYYDLLHPSHVVPGAGRSALFTASLKY
jgi:catecholate siderophore receptor